MGYLPKTFDIRNRYYYDFSITNYKKGHELYSKAAQVSLINDDSNTDIMTNITAAVNFLGKIANNERAKEVACIKYYLKILHDQMDQNNNPDLAKFFKAMQQAIQNMDPESLKENQNLLIQAMSHIRSKPELYKRRLQKLLTEPPEDWSLQRAQQEDDLVGNQVFIEKILMAEQDGTESEKKIRDAITNFINTELSNISFRKNALNNAGLIAAIAADFRAYLQEQGQDLIMNEESEKLFRQYTEANDRYFMEILKSAKKEGKEINIAYDTLLTILKDLNNEIGIMGSKAKNNLLNKLNEQKRELEEQKGKLTGQNTEDIEKQKAEIDNSISLIQKQIERIKEIGSDFFIRTHTDTSHGDVQESIETLVFRALSIPGSAAIDHIGSITIDTRIKDIFPLFKKISDEMRKITPLHVQNRKELKAYSDTYQKVNEKIQELLQEYQDTKGKEGILDYSEMFITNESAKLYWNAENVGSELEGRNIGIADALAQLYSVDEALIANQDVLIHIIVNLSSATARQQTSLEKHLSIFAGLLMFGDIRNMAIEAANFAQQNIGESMHVIHLYNINGHYIPSSIILENIYKNFQEIATDAHLEMAARASINPYKPEYNTPTTEATWDQASDDALLKTKIQLHFLKGLFNFMRDYIVKR